MNNKRQGRISHHKMAMSLVGMAFRAASLDWDTVDIINRAPLQAIVKMFDKYPNKRVSLDVSKHHGGAWLSITIKDHPFLEWFSCQQLPNRKKDDEFRCRFKIHDPVRKEWREGLVFNPEFRFFTGDEYLNLFSKRAESLRIIRKSLKDIEKVTALYLSGGVEYFQVLEEKRKKKFDRARDKERKKEVENARQDKAVFQKYGMDQPPANTVIHDEFVYAQWVRALWLDRIVGLLESHGGVIQNKEKIGLDIIAKFPSIPLLEKVTVSLGVLEKFFQQEVELTSTLVHPKYRTITGWGFDPQTRGLESLIPVRVGFALGEAGFRQVKAEVGNLFLNLAKSKSPTKTDPSSQAEPGTYTFSEVRSVLKSMKFGPAGKARDVDTEEDGWTVEPQNRQRLDHYNDWSDEDDEGWDEDGWQEDYAGPVEDATLTRLESEFGKGNFYVEVGDKGHIHIQLSPQGKKNIIRG